MVDHAVGVRSVQGCLAAVYTVLATIAIVRAASTSTAVLALAMAAGAYLTGRTIPDAHIGRNDVLRVCWLGLLIAAAGIAADMAGGHPALEWASIVMAYCAGNRLRAAGVGIDAS